MNVIERRFPNWRDLRIHESSPSIGAAITRKFREGCPNYVATQFFPGQVPRAKLQGWRNDNPDAQTFDDSTFDLVMTRDVQGHLYNPEDAFR
jgi:hypothetical protein